MSVALEAASVPIVASRKLRKECLAKCSFARQERPYQEPIESESARKSCCSCSLPPLRNVIEVIDIVRLDGTAIDPSADPLFASHKEKIEAMQEWQDWHFRSMHIVTDMSAGGGSFLKRIAQKGNCSSACKIGRARRHVSKNSARSTVLSTLRSRRAEPMEIRK
jgi:hypothetical protein